THRAPGGHGLVAPAVDDQADTAHRHLCLRGGSRTQGRPLHRPARARPGTPRRRTAPHAPGRGGRCRVPLLPAGQTPVPAGRFPGKGGQTVVRRSIPMVPLLLVLLLALILFGAGFALKALWWIAIIVFVVWLLGFVLRAGDGGRKSRWYRW